MRRSPVSPFGSESDWKRQPAPCAERQAEKAAPKSCVGAAGALFMRTGAPLTRPGAPLARAPSAGIAQARERSVRERVFIGIRHLPAQASRRSRGVGLLAAAKRAQRVGLGLDRELQ